MPVLSGSFAFVTGAQVPGSHLDVSVRAPAPRASSGGAVTTRPVRVAVDGTFTVSLVPGPAVLVVSVDGSQDTFDLLVRGDMTTIHEAATAALSQKGGR